MGLLRKEVQIKIEGKYLRGSVISDKFNTNNIIQVFDKRSATQQYSGNIIREIIKELEELADIIDANEVTELLANDDKNITDDDFEIIF